MPDYSQYWVGEVWDKDEKKEKAFCVEGSNRAVAQGMVMRQFCGLNGEIAFNKRYRILRLEKRK